MKKKIAKLGIIMVLTFALILSSLGALPFGDTLAKEFDIGAKNQTTAQAAGAWDGKTATYEWYTKLTTAASFYIATASDLKGFSNLVNGTYTGVSGLTNNTKIPFDGKRIVLTADIVLNDTINESSNVWVPIGFVDDRPFLGEFDGQSHTVSGIYVSSLNYQGLFGILGSNDVKRSTVKNVGVINSAINGVYNVAGIVARNFGKVTNCFNTGAVSGTDANVGGIVGYNMGVVTNCYNTGDMNGTQYVGGVVGQNNASGEVTNCYNTGAVTGTTSHVGGVVGGNSGEVTNCYNTGVASGTMNKVGGVVGWNNTSATVKNSYFLKTDSINNILNAAGADADTKTATCGTFGVNGVTLTAETGAIIGNKDNLFDALNAGATKFNEDNASFPNTIKATEWVEVAGSYPKHKPIVIIPDPTPITPANKFAGGNGSKETPFEISTGAELAYLAQQVNANNTEYNSKFYKLTKDIVLNDTTGWADWGTKPPANVWVPIGTAANAFQGTFDGAGHTVSGIYINGDVDNQGLFGATSGNTMVKNVGVINSYIKGKDNIGGVVGANTNGKVINCHNTGEVNGVNSVGGVVGSNPTGAVINCYNRGKVTGTKYVGGVVGSSVNIVENCYNTGAVTGTTTNIGGVVGFSRSQVNNCYFLKIAGTNETLNALGAGAPTTTCGTFTDNVGTLTPETGSSIIDSNTILFDALKAGVAAYNATESGAETPAAEWVKVAGDYPTFKAGGVTPPDPDPEPTKPFAKGEGTATAPYEISTAQELTKLSELINAADATYSVAGVHYKLTADIKLNGDKTITSTSTDATPWNSIGESGVIPFFGVFDGDGHTVSGIYIKNNDQFQGLFGVVGSDTVKTAIVKNVGVINSYIEGNGNTGGIVGANSGAVINCYNLGAVTAKGDNVGGVVGGNIGEVINCYNRGDVQQVNESDNNCGGVVGLNVGSVINCYNNGAVTGTSNVGGVAGVNNDVVINSYNTGSVKGSSEVGGVVGSNPGGTVINCYNRGDVNGTTSNVGGVVGASNSTVDNCYNTGAVTGTTTNIGGVAGYNQGEVTNSYFLKIAGGTNKNLNAAGTTADTKTATCGYFANATGALKAEAGTIIDSKNNLLDALNAGATANNTAYPTATQAMAWVKVADDYPTLKVGGVTPPTPPTGGGDSDSEPSISPEDIFWTRIVSDLKLKDEPVVEFNCKYPRMSRRVLLALQEVDKTLNINLNGEKLTITSKQVKSLTFDKASYSVAELKALLEVKPEVTPTPTPTPTQKPTEPVVPEKPAANLTWLWILLAVIAVGAVVAFVVIKRKKK